MLARALHLITGILPAELREEIRILRGYRLVGLTDAGVIATTGILALAFEMFSVAMIYPLLDYIEGGRDLAVLAERSRLWVVIGKVADAVHMPVTLGSMAAVIVALVLCRQVANYAHVMQVTRIKQRVGRDLSRLCFSAVMGSNALFMKEMNAGRFVNILDHQCQHVASLVRSYAAIWQMMLSFIAYGGVMVATAPGASLLALLVAAAVVMSLGRYMHLSRRVSREVVKLRQRFCAFMAERHQGWQVIKVSDSLDREARSFGDWAQQFFRLSVDLNRLAGRMQLVIAPAMTAFALSALYVGVEYLDLSLSIITLFILMILRMVPIAQGLTNHRQALITHHAGLEEIVEVVSQARAHKEPDRGTIPFRGLERVIEFRGVWFSYPSGRQAALRDVSVRIPAGVTTALMGPSGAGKSTLADMIPRLIVPDRGEISIDGVPLNSFSLSSLRRGISFAPQQNFLFNASVADNVRYARPSASDAEVEEACRLAYAHDFIVELPERYDTLVGEAGSRLSGGQRQRLVLARAFLSRASILILDEPTSELDYESERKIRAALENMHANAHMTIVVVAHRMSTVRNADHVIVLSDGRVLEQGSPAELIRDTQWYGAMLDLSARDAMVDP